MTTFRPYSVTKATVVTLSVAENTLSGRPVGTAVNATDTVTASPTYELGGRDASLFTIVRTSGQIQTRSAWITRRFAARPTRFREWRAPGELHLQRVSEGGRRGRRQRLQGSDNQRHRRGRTSVRAGRAQGDCDDGHGLEPRSELECAEQHRETCYHRLRRTVPQVQVRQPGRLSTVAPRRRWYYQRY